MFFICAVALVSQTCSVTPTARPLCFPSRWAPHKMRGPDITDKGTLSARLHRGPHPAHTCLQQSHIPASSCREGCSAPGPGAEGLWAGEFKSHSSWGRGESALQGLFPLPSPEPLLPSNPICSILRIFSLSPLTQAGTSHIPWLYLFTHIPRLGGWQEETLKFEEDNRVPENEHNKLQS